MEKIKVVITNNQKTFKVPTGTRMLVRRCGVAVVRMENVEGPVEISVAFVDNAQIREMNKNFRNIDSPTDVLSFASGENGEYETNPETGAKMLGDVVISLEKADEQARQYGHTFDREIVFLMAHSTLHLLGYDHEESAIERAKMREKEERIMSQMGFASSLNYTNI